MGGLKRQWEDLKILFGCLTRLGKSKDILWKLKEPWTEGGLEAK